MCDSGDEKGGSGLFKCGVCKRLLLASIAASHKTGAPPRSTADLAAIVSVSTFGKAEAHPVLHLLQWNGETETLSNQLQDCGEAARDAEVLACCHTVWRVRSIASGVQLAEGPRSRRPRQWRRPSAPQAVKHLEAGAVLGGGGAAGAGAGVGGQPSRPRASPSCPGGVAPRE